MQTATPRPAEIAPASTATSRPQSLVDTATFKLDATAVAPTKAPKPPGAPTGPCPRCQSPDPWGDSAWCLQCGFYPKLGICIPVEAIKSAALHQLASFSFVRGFAVSGGLLSYSGDFRETSQRTASFVDRILKGADPGRLPIEQPTSFELVINQRTAKALGLTIPQSLLLRATEVIN